MPTSRPSVLGLSSLLFRPVDVGAGNSLVTLGRANCKIAKLQESFAQSFHDNFMASLLRFAEDIKDYESLRKKLESRRCAHCPGVTSRQLIFCRLSYDAANAKYEKLKSGKKDKERERKDAEEDMLHAKAR